MAEEGRDPRMPVYVLEGISSEEAVRIIAAEYCHRREFSVLHTARVVRAAHETLRQNGGDARLRQLAAVLPLGRTSLGQYLVISEGIQDPRLASLVHSVDKPSKAKLYKALSQVDIRTRIAALEAMQPNNTGACSSSVRPRAKPKQTKAVRHRKRGRGFNLTIEVRAKMERSEVNRVREALLQAISDVDALFPPHEPAPGPGPQSSSETIRRDGP